MRNRIKRVIYHQPNPLTLPQEKGWVIFNAPRPLAGDRRWTGDFIAGVFYAAVDPNGDDAKEHYAFNFNMDATMLQYISPETYKFALQMIAVDYELRYTERWVRLTSEQQMDLIGNEFIRRYTESVWTVDEVNAMEGQVIL